jgi:hypothetical protein
MRLVLAGQLRSVRISPELGTYLRRAASCGAAEGKFSNHRAESREQAQEENRSCAVKTSLVLFLVTSDQIV